MSIRHQIWRVSIELDNFQLCSHFSLFRHAPGGGLANIQPGITIDLSSLNQLTISLDQSSIRIGPGNRWRNVYELLDSKDLSTSGGRVADVGVGGLVLGGTCRNLSQSYQGTDYV